MFGKAVTTEVMERYVKEMLKDFELDDVPTCEDDWNTQLERIYDHLWYDNNFNKWYGKTFTRFQLNAMKQFEKEYWGYCDVKSCVDEIVNVAVMLWFSGKKQYHDIIEQRYSEQYALCFDNTEGELDSDDEEEIIIKKNKKV